MNTSGVVLHAVWDTNMIQKNVDDNFAGNLSAYQISLLTRIYKGDFQPLVPGWESCNGSSSSSSSSVSEDDVYLPCSDQWAQESIELACSNAYVEADGVTAIKNGFNLQIDYYQRNIPIIDFQIAKAGVRLAYVLNQVFPDDVMTA